MDHHNFHDRKLNRKAAKAISKDGSLQFPFKTTLSFVPLINQWKKIVENGSKLEKKAASFLLDLIKDAKELHKSIDDPSILKAYQDEISLMMTTVFPVAVQDEVMGSAIVPYKIDAIYSTRKMQDLIRMEHDTFLKATGLTTETETMYRTISACIDILKMHYGIDIVDKHPMSVMIPDKQSGAVRHYAVDFHSAFVEIKPIGKVRKISRTQAKELMNDFFNLEKWLKWIPPHKFEFTGFATINLVDVTYQEIISSLKMDLLQKDALVTSNSIRSIEGKLRSLLNIGDLRIGLAAFNGTDEIMMNYGNKTWNSLVLMKDQPFVCAEYCESAYAKVATTKEPLIIEDVAKYPNPTPIEKSILEKGIRNMIILPLLYDDKMVGVLEMASKNVGQLDFQAVLELKEVLPLISLAVRKVTDDLNNKIQATIKEKYTVIHPTVEWKFVQSATKYLNRENIENKEIEEIVFSNVYPLYGLSDIRGSSTQRSNAIQEDLIDHLSLAKKTLQKGFEYKNMPIMQELIYRINNTVMNIRYGLKSGDEVNVIDFIKQEIDPIITNMKDWGKEMVEAAEYYFIHLDSELGVIYKKRKEFEQSLTMINDMIASYMDKQQIVAQEVFPHYYEMYKTDGVDYNIYVGQSLVQNLKFHEVYLKNLRLWQMITMAKITRKANKIKANLKNPLEIAQLILAHSSPLSIRFRTDEKQFDVDGAYNIRYEIIKKRIDKVKIKNSNERLTQPGMISIVYSQAKEASEYMKYIKYCKSIDLFTGDVEELELEELQGASGLKALRVSVNLQTRADELPQASVGKDQIQEVIDQIEAGV